MNIDVKINENLLIAIVFTCFILLFACMIVLPPPDNTMKMKNNMDTQEEIDSTKVLSYIVGYEEGYERGYEFGFNDGINGRRTCNSTITLDEIKQGVT